MRADGVEGGALGEMLAHLPAWVSVLSLDGQIRWVNRASFGYSAASLVGTDAAGTVVPEDRGLWLGALRKAAGGAPASYRVRVLTPSPAGGVALVRGRIAPVLRAGEVQALVCLSRNVSGVVVAPPPAASGRPWSPLERKVLQFLDGREGHTPAAQILGGVGEKPSGDGRGVLRNMVELGVLESTQSKGYRRKPGVEVAL